MMPDLFTSVNGKEDSRGLSGGGGGGGGPVFFSFFLLLSTAETFCAVITEAVFLPGPFSSTPRRVRCGGHYAPGGQECCRQSSDHRFRHASGWSPHETLRQWTGCDTGRRRSPAIPGARHPSA